MKKVITLVAALLLVISVSATVTLAYISDKTETVKNTFSFGDINITLTETDRAYKMVPGNYIAKDPTATVLADSEDCYLFVRLEKSENFDQFLSYNVASGWSKLSTEADVYYRVVEASEADQSFNVLENNQVFVLESVTKVMFNQLTEETLPTLTVTAYAVQYANISSAEAAWALVK